MSRKGENSALRGYGDRVKLLKKQKQNQDSAIKHLRLDVLLNRSRGTFFAYQGGGALVAVLEIEGLTTVGLSPENQAYIQERVANILGAYAREMPELSLHAWQDSSPAQREPRPTDYHNAFLSEIERERNEMEAGSVSWDVKNYIGLEYRGDFAYGGDVGALDAIKAGGKAVRAKIQRRTEDAARYGYLFKALFSGKSQRKRVFENGLNASVDAFENIIDRMMADLQSPLGGIALSKERGSLIQQVGAPDKILVHVKRLDAEAAFKAIYGLGDPDYRRRAVMRLGERIFNLSSLLGCETVNFDWLLSLARGQNYRIEDRDLRAIGEHGPYTVGGVPRQIFAVRGLPDSGLKPDAIAELRQMGVPYTLRLRWSGLTEKASQDELKKYLQKKAVKEGGEGYAHATVLMDRVTEGMAKGQGGIGTGSVLIAVNGVPFRNKDGRMLTGAEVLLNGVYRLREWANAHDFTIDPLIMDQETAHYAMYPGSAQFDPIERMPIRAYTLGKLLPLYSTSSVPPPSTIAPPILTYRDQSGQIVDRYLEVGQVGLLICCGATGSGKSYNLVDIIRQFVKNEGRVSEGPRVPITIDAFEFGAGRDEGSSFASIVRLLGGKVIHFGEGARPSAVVNAFDIPVGPGGYNPEASEILTDLLVTMCGGERQADGTGGQVDADIKATLKATLIRMGQTDAHALPGGVRSVFNLFGMMEAGEAKSLLAEWADPQQKGRYFPNAADETQEWAVLYNFSLSMPANIRAVLFAATCARLEQRMFSPAAKAKLLIGDEIGQGLAPSSNPREEAVIEGARNLIAKVFTNSRRFAGRAVIAFQNPEQITVMGSTLKSAIKSQNSGLILFPMAHEKEAKELFGLSDEFYRQLSRLPKYHCGFIQGGMMSILSNVNPSLGHAAGTTDPKECELRDTMIATGAWGNGRQLDQLSLTRSFRDHLLSLGHLHAEARTERINEIIRSYRSNAKAG